MELWPYRLAVRTPGSHPGNPGSIPGGVTRSVIHNLVEFPSFLFIRKYYALLFDKNGEDRATSLAYLYHYPSA